MITGPFLSVTATAFVFFFYIGMVLVTVPRFIEDELGYGEFGIGLAIATFAIAAVVARPFLGRLTERFGRRALMMAGALLAAAAGAMLGLATELWHVLVLRAVMGLGEAALFVAAATLIADLSPPHRRAEAASYFSVAVYGGIGIGPTLGEWVLGETTATRSPSWSPQGSRRWLRSPSSECRAGSTGRRRRPPTTKPPLFHRAALWPGVVLATGIAAFSVFSAFIPEHARCGRAWPARPVCSCCTASISLGLRLFGATMPERFGEHRMVTVALVSLAAGLLVMSAVAEPWALWVGAAFMGVGMAFMYPSLMANVINRVGDHERASALSSFTMFFELGTVIGGVLLGGVGEIFNKQAGFLGGALIAMLGLVLLWRTVEAAPFEASAVEPHVDAAQMSKNSAFANP